MRRGRNSRVTGFNSKRRRNKYQKTEPIEIPYSGPSFCDLPKDILQNILFRLPIKSIFVCKSVCKACHHLISDPQFAKLHFDETRDWFYPLILAEKFFLLQPDKDDFEPRNFDFEFDTKSDLSVSFSRHKRHDVPVRRLAGSLVHKFIRGIIIVNSCNGLLCSVLSSLKYSVSICNPITGEYIMTPEGRKPDSRRCSIRYGFGFSQVANKYKVVRIIHEIDEGFDYASARLSAQVHIVGTESWRDISSKPQYSIHGYPTYFKGFLYWSIVQVCLMFFDIENECFGLDSGPVDETGRYVLGKVGILRGELCISSVIPKFQRLYLWAKKDYGVGKAWSKVFSIDLFEAPNGASLQPIDFLSDGSLLMFFVYYAVSAFIHVDPKRCRSRFLKIEGGEVRKIVAHAPSLVSLKDSLFEHTVKELNHVPRCEVLKLHKNMFI